MWTLLLVLLIVLLFTGLPAWPYSRSWGYGPSGLLGLIVLVLLVLLLFQVVPWGYGPGPIR